MKGKVSSSAAAVSLSHLFDALLCHLFTERACRGKTFNRKHGELLQVTAAASFFAGRKQPEVDKPVVGLFFSLNIYFFSFIDNILVCLFFL
jgi:hypothetical protein